MDGAAVDNGSEVGSKRARSDGAAETEESYRRRLIRVLQTLSRSALIEVLSVMGARYQPVYDEVYKTANGNSDARKVFVRSLDYDRTTEASLREAMSKFGDLDECVIIKDRNTGKSRGFGFVIFKEIDGALAAVEAKSKEIDGRSAMILPGNKEAQEAAGYGAGGSGAGATAVVAHGGAGAAAGGTSRDARRFIVRGLAWETSTETLRATFERFGEIEEGAVVEDKVTNKSRGFGFVTMRTLEAANAVSAHPPAEIDGRRVIISLASQGPAGAGGGQGGQGGYGGGMGGQRGPQQQHMGAAGGMGGGYGAAPHGYGAPPAAYGAPAAAGYGAYAPGPYGAPAGAAAYGAAPGAGPYGAWAQAPQQQAAAGGPGGAPYGQAGPHPGAWGAPQGYAPVAPAGAYGGGPGAAGPVPGGQPGGAQAGSYPGAAPAGAGGPGGAASYPGYGYPAR